MPNGQYVKKTDISYIAPVTPANIAAIAQQCLDRYQERYDEPAGVLVVTYEIEKDCPL